VAETYDDNASALLAGLRPGRARPWQLLFVGEGARAISTESRQALAEIFDLWPELPALTLQTEKGSVRVSRDFPSAYHLRVDQAIAGIFKRDDRITAICFPGHTATPDDPYARKSGKRLAAIGKALDAGEIAPDDAARQIKALMNGDSEDGAEID
jgi:hypothetical protein